MTWITCKHTAHLGIREISTNLSLLLLILHKIVCTKYCWHRNFKPIAGCKRLLPGCWTMTGCSAHTRWPSTATDTVLLLLSATDLGGHLVLEGWFHWLQMNGSDELRRPSLIRLFLRRQVCERPFCRTMTSWSAVPLKRLRPQWCTHGPLVPRIDAGNDYTEIWEGAFLSI